MRNQLKERATLAARHDFDSLPTDTDIEVCPAHGACGIIRRLMRAPRDIEGVPFHFCHVCDHRETFLAKRQPALIAQK